jgi:alpha-ketoglutarate-dependent taurine dioxygenase
MPLELVPLNDRFGAEVRGVSLRDPQSIAPSVWEEIEEALDTHRLLVFRGQNDMSSDAQIQLSQRFGSLESTFYKHPRSPHR